MATSEGETRTKSRLTLGPKTRLAISVVLLGILLYKIDLGDAVAQLGRADPWPVVACALLIVVGRVLVAYRWYLIVHVADPTIGLGSLTRLIFVSGFLGFYAPGSVGVEMIRVYGLARRTNLALAASSVLIERLSALCALLALVFIGLAFAPLQLPTAVSWSAIAALVLIGSTVLALGVPRLRGVPLWFVQARPLNFVRTRLESLFEQADLYRDKPRLLGGLASLSIVLQLLRVLEIMALALALGIDVHVLYLFVVVPIAVFLSLLPISIQGLGVRESVYVVLLGVAGIGAPEALTLSILNFLIGLVMLTLPGAVLYALGGVAVQRTGDCEGPSNV